MQGRTAEKAEQSQLGLKLSNVRHRVTENQWHQSEVLKGMRKNAIDSYTLKQSSKKEDTASQ